MAVKTEQDLPLDDRPTYEKALKAVQVHNYGYAISLLQGVVKRTPEFLEARKALRRAEIAATKGKKNFFGGLSTLSMKGGSLIKKDPLAAIEMAEKALETDPQGAPGNNLLKDAAKAAGFPEVAAFAMETLAEANPKDTKVLHHLGELYYEQGESEKALETYNQILAINPNDLIANKRGKDAAARASMKSGGWEQVASSGGTKDYRDLIKDKELAVSIEQQNRTMRSEEEIDQQLAELHARMETEPNNIDVARKIAGFYEQQPNFESAIEWYQYAGQLAGNADPGLARKVSDLHLKVVDEQIKTREQFIAAAGDEHEQSAQYRDEITQLRKQKAGALISEARKRIERNPTDLQFRYELGEQLVAAGQFGEAIPELQKARNNPNARLRAMNLLAQCYSAKGMFDLAIKQFSDAAAEIPSMDALKKDVLYQLGLLYEKQGSPEKSLECMKQIYDVDYGYLDVAARVEKSYTS
jgi:tetratricopeptide (TPR) repeat protein